MQIKFWSGNLKAIRNLQHLGLNWRIIKMVLYTVCGFRLVIV